MRNLLVSILMLLSAVSHCQVKYGKYQLDSSDRQEVVNDTNPYRYICHLIVHRRWGGPFPSTGFIVGDGKIVTAGHSVGEYRKIFKNKIQSIEIYLFEYFENGRSYRTLAKLNISRSQIEGLEAHPKFKGKGMKNRVYDYGIIKLKSDTLSKIAGGYFELGVFDDLGVKGDSLFITGYPSDQQFIKEGSLWNKSDTKGNFTVSPNYLTYGIYTFEGDSGAPIWLKSEGKYYVVGIHNTGYTTCNGGVKITEEVVNFIDK